jgi:hypothetical protein
MGCLLFVLLIAAVIIGYLILVECANEKHRRYKKFDNWRKKNVNKG